jgi:hypothetical protein
LVSGTSFISKKIKEQGFLKNLTKKIPSKSGYGKIHPGSGSQIQGVKKHQIPDSDLQHWLHDGKLNQSWTTADGHDFCPLSS